LERRLEVREGRRREVVERVASSRQPSHSVDIDEECILVSASSGTDDDDRLSPRVQSLTAQVCRCGAIVAGTPDHPEVIQPFARERLSERLEGVQATPP
jgi:hypothetical protein